MTAAEDDRRCNKSSPLQGPFWLPVGNFIYPEGTRRLPGAKPKYKQGIAALYAENGSAVFASRGQYRAVLAETWISPLRAAVIEYLPVIEPGLDRASFGALLQATIETACERLNAEAVADDPSLDEVDRSGRSSRPLTGRRH